MRISHTTSRKVFRLGRIRCQALKIKPARSSALPADSSSRALGGVSRHGFTSTLLPSETHSIKLQSSSRTQGGGPSTPLSAWKPDLSPSCESPRPNMHRSRNDQIECDKVKDGLAHCQRIC